MDSAEVEKEQVVGMSMQLENLQNMSFAASDIQFCKFLTTPIVVKYTYTVLNKLS